MKTVQIVAICVICAATLMSGCVDPVEDGATVCAEDIVTPTRSYTPPEIIDTRSELDITMDELFDDYAPEEDYSIWTKTGDDVYVCSHFGCDMAENLINAGYNAGVVINHNDLHALTWAEVDGQVYIIEPQSRGKYWTVEEYDDGRNIDVVSLQKGREHAKSSSEGLHH